MQFGCSPSISEGEGCAEKGDGGREFGSVLGVWIVKQKGKVWSDDLQSFVTSHNGVGFKKICVLLSQAARSCILS